MDIQVIPHGALRATLIAATVATMLSLSACGGSGSISKGVGGSNASGSNSISTSGGGSSGTSGTSGDDLNYTRRFDR